MYWVPAHSRDCLDQAVHVEDIPVLGEGVNLGEMCPASQYASEATRLSVLDGFMPWLGGLAVVVGVGVESC